jgi:hypothetical protein
VLGDPQVEGVKTKEVLGAIAPMHFPFVRFGKLTLYLLKPSSPFSNL